jgi:tetratricopeptide (TPR) repeat protein
MCYGNRQGAKKPPARSVAHGCPQRPGLIIQRSRNCLHEQPDYAEALSVSGMANAALGHKEEVLREGRRAAELLPVTKDAVTGAEILRNLAATYAWAGEKDLALNQLEKVVRMFGPVSYGQLRLHPFWDPLRGDPRFDKLVEESKKLLTLR